MGDFSLSMDNLLKQIDKNKDDIIKKTVFDLTSSFIKDTPVDTGRARANWQVDLNTNNNESIINDISDRSGSKAINNAQNKIMNNNVPFYYMISNNLPYIERLEYGWSKQSPQGMVRINILRFNQFFKNNTKG